MKVVLQFNLFYKFVSIIIDEMINIHFFLIVDG